MHISIVVASALNGTIGLQNRMPWHLTDDLKHFRTLTTGHTVLMGRKTFDSIGKPLPNRQNFVLTRQVDALPAHPHLQAFHSLATAIETAQKAGETELFIIGGGNLYQQASPLANRLYWTRIQAEIQGDTFFYPPDISTWTLVNTITFEANEKNDFTFTIETWEK